MAAITGFTYKGVRYYAEDSDRVLRKDEVRTKDGVVVKVVSANHVLDGHPSILVALGTATDRILPFVPPGDTALQRAWRKLYKFRPDERFDEETKRVVPLGDMEFVHEGEVYRVRPNKLFGGWNALQDGRASAWSRPTYAPEDKELLSLRDALVTFLRSKGLEP